MCLSRNLSGADSRLRSFLVTPAVSDLVGFTKQALFDLAGDGHIFQSGGEVLDPNFAVPDVSASVEVSPPSIETFVVSNSGQSVMPIGMNDELNEAWMPAVTAMAEAVVGWLDEHGISLAGDAYITTSITAASEVNGEAHFDDDQFAPQSGAGVFAIVADLAGPKALTAPLPYPPLTAPHPLTLDDELKAEFENAGSLDPISFGANELVLMPQFGQLHSGPGPCGTPDQRRHLMVFRGETVPSDL